MPGDAPPPLSDALALAERSDAHRGEEVHLGLVREVVGYNFVELRKMNDNISANNAGIAANTLALVALEKVHRDDLEERKRNRGVGQVLGDGLTSPLGAFRFGEKSYHFPSPLGMILTAFGLGVVGGGLQLLGLIDLQAILVALVLAGGA